MKLCPTCQSCYEDEDLTCSQQGHASLTWKRTGTRFINNRYRLDKLLGRGAMGAVYRCTHLELDHPMAIKLLLPDSADADPYGRQRMRREALTACRLNHPNLVHVHDCGTNVVVVEDAEGTHKHDELYIVMELLEGQTLQDYLHQTKPLPLRLAVNIARQVACGLAEVHSKGIVHRDLKPANIMITYDYRGDLLVKIVDFGTVKFIEQNTAFDDADLTGAMMVGSARYTSPENCRGEPLDERSDIYCLGLILYEMIAGQHPFNSRSRADLIHNHAYLAPPSLDEICDNVPKPLVHLIMSSLEKYPEARLKSASEFAQMLFAFEQSGDTTAVFPDLNPTQGRISTTPQSGTLNIEEPSPDEDTVVATLPLNGLSQHEGSGNRNSSIGIVSKTSAEQGEVKRLALALMYFTAFLMTSAFLAWSLLSKGPIAEGSVGMPVDTASYEVASPSVEDELITTTDVNIRSEPNRSSQRIGLAEKGSRVRILSRSGNWREVIVLEHRRPKKDQSSEDQGWLAGEFLRQPDE